MRFDFNLSETVQQQLSGVARKMHDWEAQALISQDAAQNISQRIQFFNHTSQMSDVTYTGVDGSGDYPLLTYADAFVYLTVAYITTYGVHPNPIHGLQELRQGEQLVNFTWLPGDQAVTRQEVLAAFEAMTGESVAETIEQSDYRKLKARYSRLSVDSIIEKLVIPHASESGNHAIQLRTVGELGAALRTLRAGVTPNYLLYDSTLALPLFTSTASLFLEHLKRRVCMAAREAETVFMAVSKSPGLPGMEELERLALQRYQAEVRPDSSVAEHWFLRLPIPDHDDWAFPPVDGRAVPPPGAVSYLVRFHRNAPVLRLDLDLHYWQDHLCHKSGREISLLEQRIFEQLDFCSHDQRSYGYPYPIKAAHNHASLTAAERLAFKTQLIDAAVRAGMNRKLFRDASMQTGHR